MGEAKNQTRIDGGGTSSERNVIHDGFSAPLRGITLRTQDQDTEIHT